MSTASVIERPEVVVIGAGLIGLACARDLHSAGLHVEVLEARSPGAGASSAAGGMISPLVETQDDTEFFEICRQARDLWQDWAPALAEESGIDLDYDTSGTLFPALDSADTAFLERLKATASGVGEPVEEIGSGELERLVPGIAKPTQKTILLRGEHRVDNVKVIRALTRVLRRRGVLIHSRRPVDRLESRSGLIRLSGPGWATESSLVVLAAGAWSGTIEGAPTPPVRPIKGQMIFYEGVKWPWQGCVRNAAIYGVRRHGDGLLIGATMEDVGFNTETTEEGRRELEEKGRRLLPQLQWKRQTGHWAGLRPDTPDHLPIVGPHEDLPILLATGHFRNGVLLAPWTARVITSMALASDLPMTPGPFSPNRF